VRVVPVIAALALAAPVASASAQTTPAAGSNIPCYPYPAFCGPNGQPWFPLSLPFQPLQFGPGPVQIPTVQFGPGPVQIP
jgi:hypothetical protein